MMKWSHTLIAGGALILLTNAVVLFGARDNRDGEPDSQLLLTQRELQHSTWQETRENSGMTLTLNWRFEQAGQSDLDSGLYSVRSGMPVWLDQAKMSELGFDVDRLANAVGSRERYQELQPKEVLLVLELNDRAYQHQLQRAKDYLDQAKARLDAAPDIKELKRKAKSAEENYLHEQQSNSRLFVVDAGLDLPTLRATYPDRARYAIVHGLIRPGNVRVQNKASVGGYISELQANRINVPFSYRQVFSNAEPYEVAVAFGKRLEPWIVTAANSVAADQ
jgi:hypothetical protein